MSVYRQAFFLYVCLPAGVILAGSAAETRAQVYVANLAANDAVVIHIGSGDPAETVGYQEGSDYDVLGNEGSGATLRNGNLIWGFELPVLPGSLESVTLTFTKINSNGTFDWGGQLYAFDPGVNPRDLADPDFSSVHHMGLEPDSSSDVRLLSANVVDRTVPNGPVTVDVTAAFLPGGVLADFYDETGTPTSTNAMIWFRLSPGGTTTGTHRIRIDNSIGGETSPDLRFVVIPEPSTVALFLGLAVAAGSVAFQRRFR